MFTQQWECRSTMIKSYIAPLRRLVTCLAVLSILTIVLVLRGMAGVTILRRTFIDSVHMAGCASDSLMRIHQRECRGVMIESYIAPLGRLVACLAVLPKLTIMFILRTMTGVTVLRRTLEGSVLMAG